MPEAIEQYLDASLYNYTIAYTERAAHAHEIAKEAIGKHDIIVAVGGDGTINEIASALVGSEAILGIIPFGSGNGLSRFLGLSMEVEGAIRMLNDGLVECIDSADADGGAFFNMAGMGFDAHIADVFANQKTRGFITYIKSTLKEVFNYKPQTYQLNIDGAEHEFKAFMLSFANSSQYGNDAHISPKASVQDGLIDVCVIKPFPAWRFPEMGLRMFLKTTDKSKYVEIICGKHIKVKRNAPGPMHLDGEPTIAPAQVEINIKPNSLKVIVGKTFKNG